MHRCSNSSSAQGNILGPCTCGLLHTQTNNSFSMLFSMPNHKPFDETEMYYSNFTSSSSSSPYSSSVDCTLSLGTPSTRLSNDDHHHHHHHHEKHHHQQQQPPPTRHEQQQQRRPSSSCMSNFCWDILQSKHTSSTTTPSHKTSRGGNNNNNINTACDPLVARRCANCDTTSTPLWRNGPRGPKSLCNACGIRFKKEERRASAAATTTTTTNSTASISGGVMEAQQQQHMISQHNNNNNNNPWAVHHYSQSQSSSSQKIPCHSPGGNIDQFRFIEDDGGADTTGIPFLSWRLNVTDRPSLVGHDFTR